MWVWYLLYKLLSLAYFIFSYVSTHWFLGVMVMNNDLKSVISDSMLQIMIMNISCENALRWLLQDTFDDKSTMVQVMIWCCQPTSHCLSQRWPRSKALHGATRLKCINSSPPSGAYMCQGIRIGSAWLVFSLTQDQMLLVQPNFWSQGATGRPLVLNIENTEKTLNSQKTLNNCP